MLRDSRAVLVLPVLGTLLLGACVAPGNDDTATKAAGSKAVCPAEGESIVLDEWTGVAPTDVEGAQGNGDRHALQVPAGCNYTQLEVRIEWDNEVEDVDLDVLDPQGGVAATSGDFNALEGAAVEVATVSAPVAGEYTSFAKSYLNVETAYRGTATLHCLTPGGCAGGSTSVQEVAAAPKTTRVVVAVIDSGINVYHEFFYKGAGPYADGIAPTSVNADILSSFGIGPDCQIQLSRTGDFATDFAADTDAGVWNRVAACDVVWFRGTNVLAKSHDPGTAIILPDDEDDTHGVGTGAAVLKANPEAVLLFLEGVGEASEKFAMTHPEVDIVSTSYGPVGSAPIPENLGHSFEGVYDFGKLHFGACDNSPSTAVQDGTCGPWWSIGVAGFEERDQDYTTGEEQPASHGRQIMSGNLPDFLSDFTQVLPYCQACEDGYDRFVGGTSFATPRSAGTASKILLAARRAVGHTGAVKFVEGGRPLFIDGQGPNGPVSVTNWQFRRVLEEAAWIPPTDEYDVVNGATDWVAAYPIPPEAPWLVTGWGILSPDRGIVVDDSINVLLGNAPTQVKASGFCTHQTTLIDARKLYWDFVAVDSETYLNSPEEDPFVYCN